jgi:hypothetical protein
MLAMNLFGLITHAAAKRVDSDYTFKTNLIIVSKARGCIFSCVQPFYERAVSDLDP